MRDASEKPAYVPMTARDLEAATAFPPLPPDPTLGTNTPLHGFLDFMRRMAMELTEMREFQAAIAATFGMVHEPDSGPTWPADLPQLVAKAQELKVEHACLGAECGLLVSALQQWMETRSPENEVRMRCLIEVVTQPSSTWRVARLPEADQIRVEAYRIALRAQMACGRDEGEA